MISVIEKGSCLIHLWVPQSLTKYVAHGGCLVSILYTEQWKPTLQQHLLGWLVSHVQCIWPCSLPYEQQKSWSNKLPFIERHPRARSYIGCFADIAAPWIAKTVLPLLVCRLSKWDNWGSQRLRKFQRIRNWHFNRLCSFHSSTLGTCHCVCPRL